MCELALGDLFDAAAELGCLLVQEQPFHVHKRLSRVERSRRRLGRPEELEHRARALVAYVCGQNCRERAVPAELRCLHLGRTLLRIRIADREAVPVELLDGTLDTSVWFFTASD
jgi:hypothetical protein